MEPPTAPPSTEPPSTVEAPPPLQAPPPAAQPTCSSAPPASETLPPPSAASAPAPSSPTPTPTLSTPLQPQHRPPIHHNRPQSTYPHFPHSLPSPPSTAAASSSSFHTTSTSPSTMARGGLAIGVPAHHHPRPPQPPVTLSPFSPSTPFSRPISSLTRTSIGGPEQSTISNTQVRQPTQGIHNIGMIGSLSTGQIRPTGIPGQPQQRLGQPSLRATSPSASPSLSSQKFHGHALSRAPSMTSPSSPSPVPQNSQSFQQPLLSAQGKQIHAASLPSSSYKPQMKPQASQQRPHHLQQHHQSLLSTSHHQQTPSSQQQQQQKHQQLHQQLQQQQQASLPHQPQEHNSQQYLTLRNQQSMPQQQAARAHGPTTLKSNVPAVLQSGVVQSGVSTPIVNMDAAESGNHIVRKRSIRELVTEIDPSEKLDPEVEDALAEVADSFIESVTTFACSLAKHRKSTTLEAKDILLHVERNFNMTLPGFGGDEIKCYKKQPTNDIHKERLALIKKSMAGSSDAGNTKNPPTGQAAVNRKAHSGKAPATTGQADRGS